MHRDHHKKQVTGNMKSIVFKCHFREYQITHLAEVGDNGIDIYTLLYIK